MARRRGLDLCNGGQTAQGVLWLARALELAPEEDRDLQQTLRADLAHWQREMPSLRALMRPGASVSFTGPLATARSVFYRNILRLHDLHTNKPLGPPIWWDSPYTAVSANPRSFSPDGKRFLLVQGKEVRIWNVAAAAQPAFVLAHDTDVKQADWSPDARRIVSVEHTRTQPGAAPSICGI